MKARWLTAFLTAAISLPVIVPAQAKRDSVIFVDPTERFKWVMPSQQVAGLDVEMWACHAHLKNGRNQQPKDSTTVQFFVPENYPLFIEIREKHHLSELRPGRMPWPAGLFQCFEFPNTMMSGLSIEHANLSMVGRVREANCNRIIPVARNAQAPDTLSYYEFKFRPNMDIRVMFSITRDGVVVEPESPLCFYPGRDIFTITWDGLVKGKPAPEGNYKLLLKGWKHLGPERLEMVRCYYFYHKTFFGTCVLP